MEVMAAADNSPLLLAYIVVPLIVLAAGPAPCLYAQASLYHHIYCFL
jgi:hypothetical protein